MSYLSQIIDDRVSPPKVSLVAMIIIGSILTTISAIYFWNSDTRVTVQTIQATSQSKAYVEQPAVSINNDGKLSVAELLLIVESVNAQNSGISPQQDLGGSSLEPVNLGF